MGCGSSASASEPGSGGSRAVSGGGQKGKNLFPGTVEFTYFGLNGRADPLRMMFEYHGQPYKKNEETPESWEAKKAAGQGGEFGGGLPQAQCTIQGKQMNFAQFGAILRMFCVRYGYYNTKDAKCSRYHDPIVDTWADALGKSSAILFGGEEKKQDNINAFVEFAKLYNALVEKNFAHHNGKYVGGNSIGMGDFVMAAWIGNFFMNDSNPVAPLLKPTLNACPKLKAYAENVIMKEFAYLKTRGPQPPF